VAKVWEKSENTMLYVKLIILNVTQQKARYTTISRPVNSNIIELKQ
jgi:hypothetical protein